MLRILVVEDEELYARLLELHIRALGYEMVGPAATAAEALRLFDEAAPDLVLLDVGLDGPTDGIELAHLLVQRAPVPIIFETAFADEATFARARAVGPYAYITKPFDAGTVQRAVELALQRFSQSADEEATTTAMAPNDGVVLRGNLFVKDGSRLVRILADEIRWVGAEERYCMLVMANGRRYSLRTSLRELLDQLPPEDFLQVHRGAVINVAAIDSVDTASQTVRLVGGETIPLGRSYRDLLLRRLRLLG